MNSKLIIEMTACSGTIDRTYCFKNRVEKRKRKVLKTSIVLDINNFKSLDKEVAKEILYKAFKESIG